MLKHTWSALVLATLVATAACDGGNVFGGTRVPSGGNGTAGTINGQVQAGGSGLGGVTVLLGTADSTVTNTAGRSPSRICSQRRTTLPFACRWATRPPLTKRGSAPSPFPRPAAR